MPVFNQDMGTGRPWVARFRVKGPYLPAKGADGRIRQCYHGSCLDWLSPVEEKHFLRLGLVERIPEAEQAAIPADVRQAVGVSHAAEQAQAEVDESNEMLDDFESDCDRLEIPQDSGAPFCRKALRDAGISYSNELIALGVRRRKARAALAETAATA